MPAARVGIHAAWAVITLMSMGVGGYALFHTFTGSKGIAPGIMGNHFFTPLGIKIHIAAAGVALFIGAFQFLKPLRQKLPKLHRWNGRIYIAACTVGGLAGGAIALFSTSGPVAGWGFFTLAVLWVPFTLLALMSAMRRNFVAHEQWMIRSFALTFGAVTLRLYLPIGDMTVGFNTAYPIIAWLAWVPNLIVAEIWIAMRRKPRRKAPNQAAESAA